MNTENQLISKPDDRVLMKSASVVTGSEEKQKIEMGEKSPSVDDNHFTERYENLSMDKRGFLLILILNLSLIHI